MFLWALGPSWTPHKNFLPPLFYSSCDIYLWHQDNRIIFIHTSLIFLKIHFHCRMFHNFSICKLFAFFSQISQFAVECSTILSKIPLSKVLGPPGTPSNIAQNQGGINTVGPVPMISGHGPNTFPHSAAHVLNTNYSPSRIEGEPTNRINTSAANHNEPSNSKGDTKHFESYNSTVKTTCFTGSTFNVVPNFNKYVPKNPSFTLIFRNNDQILYQRLRYQYVNLTSANKLVTIWFRNKLMRGTTTVCICCS